MLFLQGFNYYATCFKSCSQTSPVSLKFFFYKLKVQNFVALPFVFKELFDQFVYDKFYNIRARFHFCIDTIDSARSSYCFP